MAVTIIKGPYIGNTSDKAKEIIKVYIGSSSNKAQKIVKGYIGDSNGIARLCFGPKYKTGTLPNLTSNNTTIGGYTYKTSATSLATGRAAWHAFDNSDDTMWSQVTGGDIDYEHITIDLGRQVMMQKITVTVSFDASKSGMKSFNFKAYHNQSTYISCTMPNTINGLRTASFDVSSKFNGVLDNSYFIEPTALRNNAGFCRICNFRMEWLEPIN